jgi:hypothetical protein
LQAQPETHLRWDLSQISLGKRCYVVDAPSEAI